MNNTVTQVIVCLAGLAVIAACCVYMINAGKNETPKQQTTGMPVEILQQWEQAKKEAVEKETETLRKRVEELEEEVKDAKNKSAKPTDNELTIPHDLEKYKTSDDDASSEHQPPKRPPLS